MHEVVEHVTCHKCRRFMGLITTDGRGPIFDADCDLSEAERSNDPKVQKLMAEGKYEEADELAKRSRYPAECPMLKKLAAFQPKRIPMGVGNRHYVRDEDAQGYETVAKRAMEE